MIQYPLATRTSGAPIKKNMRRQTHIQYSISLSYLKLSFPYWPSVSSSISPEQNRPEYDYKKEGIKIILIAGTGHRIQRHPHHNYEPIKKRPLASVTFIGNMLTPASKSIAPKLRWDIKPHLAARLLRQVTSTLEN